jgi:hypothetical protein
MRFDGSMAVISGHGGWTVEDGRDIIMRSTADGQRTTLILSIVTAALVALGVAGTAGQASAASYTNPKTCKIQVPCPDSLGIRW